MRIEVRRASDKSLLIVVFEPSSNFRIAEDGKATWCPKWQEIDDLLFHRKVVEYGNRKIREEEYREMYS